MKIDKNKLTLELANQGWHALSIRINHASFRAERYKDLPLTNVDLMVDYLYTHMTNDKEEIRKMVTNALV